MLVVAATLVVCLRQVRGPHFNNFHQLSDLELWTVTLRDSLAVLTSRGRMTYRELGSPGFYFTRVEAMKNVWSASDYSTNLANVNQTRMRWISNSTKYHTDGLRSRRSASAIITCTFPPEARSLAEDQRYKVCLILMYVDTSPNIWK